MNIALIGLRMTADVHVAAIKSFKNGFNLRSALWCGSVKKTNFTDQNTLQASDCILELYQVKSTDFFVRVPPPIAWRQFFETLAVAGNPILMEKLIDHNISAAVQND